MPQIHFGVRHRREHTFYKCEFCPTRSFFHAEKDASNHIRSNHLDTSSQIRASPLFPTEMYSKNPAKVHRCKLCPAEYESETKYLMHLAMHFEPFKCQLCPKSYRVEYLLERHVRESHQSNQVCISCTVLAKPLIKLGISSPLSLLVLLRIGFGYNTLSRPISLGFQGQAHDCRSGI